MTTRHQHYLADAGACSPMYTHIALAYYWQRERESNRDQWAIIELPFQVTATQTEQSTHLAVHVNSSSTTQKLRRYKKVSELSVAPFLYIHTTWPSVDSEHHTQPKARKPDSQGTLLQP